MKLRTALILMALTLLVPALRAQTNCCVIAAVNLNDAKTATTVPASGKNPSGIYVSLETQTYQITCTNSGTGKVCFTPTVTPNVVQNVPGSYGYLDNQFIACNPTWTNEASQSSSMSVNASFTNTGIGYTGLNANGTCIPSLVSYQDTSNCTATACPTVAGGGGGDCCPNPDVISNTVGSVSPEDTCCPSPIILDIDGNGYFLTSAASGVSFDIRGDGHPIQIGWTAEGADNAFLALPGPDGQIQNGKQLFGNYTPQPPSAHPNGFLALAVYDLPANGGNGDGIIDYRDAIFSSLRLWVDKNHDGISQPDEIYTLPALGINSISLKYALDRKTDEYGNRFRYRARLNPDKSDEAGKTAYDIFFVMLDSMAQERSCSIPLLVPSASGKH